MNKLLTLLLLLALSMAALPQGKSPKNKIDVVSQGKGNQKKKPPQPPIVQPPVVSAWSLQIANRDTHQYEAGALLNEGVVAFLFTDYPRIVGKLTRSNTGALYGNLFFTVTITTTGSPQFIKAPEEGNTCDTPANFRAYVEAPDWADFYNPDGTEKPGARHKRWWSNSTTVTLAGTLTVSMSVPIRGDMWTSVFGASGDSSEAAMWFAQTMNNPGAAGFTYGSGCWSGHGIFVTGGTAKFTLNEFRTGF
jgi:hypothetical protein